MLFHLKNRFHRTGVLGHAGDVFAQWTLAVRKSVPIPLRVICGPSKPGGLPIGGKLPKNSYSDRFSGFAESIILMSCSVM